MNRPGRRVVVIRDGKRVIRRFWGGFSPKIYDGYFVELERAEFTSTFKVRF